MKKHRYQAKALQDVNWPDIAFEVANQRLVFAVDVAKEKFVAALMIDREEPLSTIMWDHPAETRTLGVLLGDLPADHIEVVMEPSGTYGDSVREHLRSLGCEIFLASPKRVHDAAEVYDGVPSLHDAKAAYIIGRLHLDGASQPWPENSAHRRDQKALIAELDLYQSDHRRNFNRLEAQLSRHWPELEQVADVDSAGVLRLLADYGDPRSVCRNRDEAEKLIHHTRRGVAASERVSAILDSAEASLGVPCTEGERHLLQTLAEELRRTRAATRAVQRSIDIRVDQDVELSRIGKAFGNATSLVLEAALGSPLDYPNAGSYVKAMGLNLKERSSGTHKGELHITKRGPGRARHYLFLAAMRAVQRDPVIRAWYRKKLTRDGKVTRYNAQVAVMRKLGMAIWHVARGSPFDSSKLFNVANLDLANT